MTAWPPRRGVSLLRSALESPTELAFKTLDRLGERREPRAEPYPVDERWEERLHAALHAPWPCPDREVFDELWADVTERLKANDLPIGRGAFGGWGDADPAFARATWCVALHSRATVVVETGVARGITSRFLLEALWRIDLPPPLDHDLHAEIGVAVPLERRGRWTYVRGSSRRRLRPLLARLGRVDVFVHDSRHSTRNVGFELVHAWKALRAGGILLVDDIDLNEGFRHFCREHDVERALTCPSEPLAFDPERQDGTGVFGIILAG